MQQQHEKFLLENKVTVRIWLPTEKKMEINWSTGEIRKSFCHVALKTYHGGEEGKGFMRVFGRISAALTMLEKLVTDVRQGYFIFIVLKFQIASAS